MKSELRMVIELVGKTIWKTLVYLPVFLLFGFLAFHHGFLAKGVSVSLALFAWDVLFIYRFAARLVPMLEARASLKDLKASMKEVDMSRLCEVFLMLGAAGSGISRTDACLVKEARTFFHRGVVTKTVRRMAES